MASPYPLRECKICRKSGNRNKVPTINGLCFEAGSEFHYQARKEAKTAEQIEKQNARNKAYAEKNLAKFKEASEAARRSVYIELPSGEQGTLEGKLITPAKKVAKIKSVSDKRAKELREYEKEKAKHFEEFPVCQFPGCGSSNVQLHHAGGRTGSMLTDRRHFRSLCDFHHRWVELHPFEAKEMGLSISRLSKAS